MSESTESGYEGEKLQESNGEIAKSSDRLKMNVMAKEIRDANQQFQLELMQNHVKDKPNLHESLGNKCMKNFNIHLEYGKAEQHNKIEKAELETDYLRQKYKIELLYLEKSKQQELEHKTNLFKIECRKQEEELQSKRARLNDRTSCDENTISNSISKAQRVESSKSVQEPNKAQAKISKRLRHVICEAKSSLLNDEIFEILASAGPCSCESNLEKPHAHYIINETELLKRSLSYYLRRKGCKLIRSNKIPDATHLRFLLQMLQRNAENFNSIFSDNLSDYFE